MAKIQDLPEDDRPREKLMRGIELSNAELIAILLGTGSAQFNAVQVAQSILDKTEGDLYQLSRLSYEDIQDGIKGVGDVKAITIKAALLLGNRVRKFKIKEQPFINQPSLVYDLMREYIADKNHEEFWVIYLDQANKLKDKPVLISKGSTNATVVDKKEIFRNAIMKRAEAIILTHNHPSGQLKPSDADIQLTNDIKKLADFHGIRLLDHIIYTDAHGFYSFSENGLI